MRIVIVRYDPISEEEVHARDKASRPHALSQGTTLLWHGLLNGWRTMANTKAYNTAVTLRGRITSNNERKLDR